MNNLKLVLVSFGIFLLVVIMFTIASYYPEYRSKIIYDKYVKDYINKEYPNANVKYVENDRCLTSGGVWFPKRVKKCYRTSYLVETENNSFNIYITDYYKEFKDYSGIYAYISNTDQCNTSEIESWYDYINPSSECVTKIK